MLVSRVVVGTVELVPGAMTGFSVPEGLIACVDAFRDGGYAAAREVWRDYLPLVNFEFQAGIALGLRKRSLVLRGLISYDAVRPPAAVPPESMLRLLAEHLRRTPAVTLPAFPERPTPPERSEGLL